MDRDDVGTAATVDRSRDENVVREDELIRTGPALDRSVDIDAVDVVAQHQAVGRSFNCDDQLGRAGRAVHHLGVFEGVREAASPGEVRDRLVGNLHAILVFPVVSHLQFAVGAIHLGVFAVELLVLQQGHRRRHPLQPQSVAVEYVAVDRRIAKEPAFLLFLTTAVLRRLVLGVVDADGFVVARDPNHLIVCRGEERVGLRTPDQVAEVDER